MSKSNAKIEKGNFVIVRIPIVDRASGDLPRLVCRVDDIIGKDASLYNKGNNKITELRTILQRESQNS